MAFKISCNLFPTPTLHCFCYWFTHSSRQSTSHSRLPSVAWTTHLGHFTSVVLPIAFLQVGISFSLISSSQTHHLSARIPLPPHGAFPNCAQNCFLLLHSLTRFLALLQHSFCSTKILFPWLSTYLHSLVFYAEWLSNAAGWVKGWREGLSQQLQSLLHVSPWP